MPKILLGQSDNGNFYLPIEVSTQTILLVGKRGSGKSSAATRLAEQLIANKVQIAVLDPPDVWWGLKSSKDGNSDGLPVYVFGGRHADLPLESKAGALMADLLVDDGINAIMSLRHFSNLERSNFAIDFADRLFQRNTRPLMLFCEEAHRLMPQNLTEYGKGSRVEEMLGKMLKLQTEGRTSGIGLTAVTQRPAALHKTFTTQSEMLIALRTLGPQDRDAIEAWIKYHRQDEDKQEMLSSLAELKTGDAWVWSPDFPEDEPIGLKRVHFLLPETFDSRRTPKPGEHLVEPKRLAPVDLDRLKGRMAATIERAKADDPRELRKQISELRAQLKKQLVVGATKTVEVSDPKAILVAVRKEAARWKKIYDEQQSLLVRVADLTGRVFSLTKTLPASPEATALDTVTVPVKHVEMVRPPVIPYRITEKQEGNGEVKGTPLKMLNALADFEALGREQTRKAVVASWCGIKHTTGTWGTYLSSLTSRGLVEVCPDRNFIRLTEQGRAIAGQGNPPSSNEEMLGRCMEIIGGTPAKMLKVLFLSYPSSVPYEELAATIAPPISASTGTFGTYLSTLSSAEMVVREGGRKVKCAEWLFIE